MEANKASHIVQNGPGYNLLSTLGMRKLTVFCLFALCSDPTLVLCVVYIPVCDKMCVFLLLFFRVVSFVSCERQLRVLSSQQSERSPQINIFIEKSS